jgi:hypothetical protein
MNTRFRPFALLALVLGLSTLAASPSRAADETVYELRTYYTNPGKLDTLLKRFRDHTCRIFEKHGMVNIGYWVPTDEKDGAGNKLVYILKHKSRDGAMAAWKEFSADPEWQAVAKASEANGKIVDHVDRVFVAAADFSPDVTKAVKGQGHVYELRTYHCADGKLPALDTRFRNHTRTIFEKHGMTNVIYTHPLDADKGAGQTLIYMLAFPSREAATKSWAEFRADPVWVAAKSESERGGPLTTKVDSVFLKPTDFSPLK